MTDDTSRLVATTDDNAAPLPVGGAGTTEREAQAGYHRDRGGADRGLRQRLARPARSPTQRPPGAVACVCRQGRARSAADQHADRVALRGQELATACGWEHVSEVLSEVGPCRLKARDANCLPTQR